MRTIDILAGLLPGRLVLKGRAFPIFFYGYRTHRTEDGRLMLACTCRTIETPWCEVRALVLPSRPVTYTQEDFGEIAREDT